MKKKKILPFYYSNKKIKNMNIAKEEFLLFPLYPMFVLLGSRMMKMAWWECSPIMLWVLWML